MRTLNRLVVAALLLGIAACSDQLGYPNPNNPDRDLALARPTDVENLIAGSYKTIHDATYGTTNSIHPGMLTMAQENYALLGNFGMVLRAQIPRVPIDNSRGNSTAGENYNPYLVLNRAARQAAVGLEKVNDPSFTFFPASAAQVLRARSFGYFVLGLALGDLSMAYDSGAVIAPGDPAGTPVPLPFVAYDSLGRVALRYLDIADSIGSLSAAAGAFPMPATWINGNALTQTQYSALLKGYKARIRAGNARNATEAAALDWTRINADATAFLAQFPNDFTITLQTATPSWNNSLAGTWAQFSSWHQMWSFMVGMADTSLQYDAWLSTQPIANRLTFLIQTPDLRFPSGSSRAAQNTSSGFTSSGGGGLIPPNLASGQPWYNNYPYIRNRLAGNDVFGDPLANSQYDFYRFNRMPTSASNGGLQGNGPWPAITAAEMRLLRAEGHLRSNQVALATADIDVTRTGRGGLPAISGVITNLTQTVPPHPGGGPNSCVPRVPQGPNYTSAGCGNVWEALKWEKRLETAYSAWGNWYLDARRWGDLPEGTPVHYPVPYQELDTRRQPIYNMGGVGQTGGSVGRGTYGL